MSGAQVSITSNLDRASVRSNSTRHNPGEAARDVLILFRRLNTREDFLDTDANLCAAGNLLNLADSALLVALRERARCLENVCEFGLRVDIRHRDLGVKATEEVKLSENRALGRGGEDQKSAILNGFSYYDLQCNKCGLPWVAASPTGP